MQKNSILKTKTLFTNARVYKAMADNKFYLILTEEEVEDRFFTKELAIKDAKQLALQEKKTIYFMECTKVFAVECNVTETTFEETT